MKESILERSLITANIVANILAEQEVYEHMKESILERSHINANIAVVSVLAKQEI